MDDTVEPDMCGTQAGSMGIEGASMLVHAGTGMHSLQCAVLYASIVISYLVHSAIVCMRMHCDVAVCA